VLKSRTRRGVSGRRLLPLLVLAGVLVLAGCGSRQDTLRPEGPQAKEIASLWWWLMGGAFVGLGFVSALLLLSWFRRNKMGPGREPGERLGWIVVVTLGIGTMIAGLVALFVVADVFVIRHTEAPAAGTTKLTVRAVGHQWFWEFDYPGTPAVTADEMHIPVRTPVLVEALTVDVIHSFWVPELNRKIDTIPGQNNTIELYADRIGRYRGECNQFCGLQHAHMSFYVVAESEAQFRTWLANQETKAAAPTTALARRGEQVFMNGPCSSCHTIRGTKAHGYVGPDLTHLQSRRSLAGATIANTRSELGEWIVDSQHIKPGNQMPDVSLPGPQLQALLDYLEGLK
jgi:cytochrome c oxidase subunit 2